MTKLVDTITNRCSTGTFSRILNAVYALKLCNLTIESRI